MHDTLARLRDNVLQVFLGPPAAVDRAIICLLARGHILIEDVPGVGKTLLANAIARSVDAKFTRIQLTPDMLPGDVLGVSVLDRETGEFHFKPGPVFTNVLLADEINRTTPRTQSALLEAMSEATVSIDGHTLPIEAPFFVVATQNPTAFEGTFPLPENQLDRFLMRIDVGYPDAEAEVELLDARPMSNTLPELSPVVSVADVLALQNEADRARLDPVLREFIVAFARATREHPDLRVGLSPRGSLALAQAARATALLDGRDYVIPEDITENIAPVCGHRIVTRSGAGARPAEAAAILDDVTTQIPAPV